MLDTTPRSGAGRRGVHLRWLAVDESAPDPAGFLHLLSAPERHRAETAAPADAARFVLGRMLARALVGELVGMHPAAVRILACCPYCRGAHGRPRAECGSLRPPAISIAHCAEAIVVAACFDGAVGVDVEALDQPLERRAALAALGGRSFAPGVADPLLHWTRVTAALKADGRGPDVDPRSVHVHAVGTALEARFADGPRYRLATPQIDPRLRVSVAVEQDAAAGLLLAWQREDGEALLA